MNKPQEIMFLLKQSIISTVCSSAFVVLYLKLEDNQLKMETQKLVGALKELEKA